MNDLYIGIAVVILSCCIYTGAFRLNGKKPAIALALLIIGGLLLRAYVASDSYLHEWDERYHALVAKNLMGHFLQPTLYDIPLLPLDETNWTISHIWLHKQPLPLWLIALSLKVFGVKVWVVRLPSIILSTIGIKLVYDVAAYLSDKRRAFIAAFLFSIHGLIIELTAGRHPTEHIDVCFMFFILLGVWFTVKSNGGKHWGYAVLIGASIGCAIMSKWLPAFIVLPIWGVLCYKNLSAKQLCLQGGIILAATCAVALPWQLYIMTKYPLEAFYEYAYNTRHFTRALEGQGNNFFFHFDNLRMSFGELIYLPVVWFTYKAIKHYTPTNMAVFIWFWVTYLFFSLSATKMTAYIILAAPAIFMITADAFITLKDNVQFKPRSLKLVVAYSFILLPVRYAIERIKPFDGSDHNPEWNKTIEQFVKTDLNFPKTVVFNCPHYIELMFLSHCICYEQMPDDTTLSRIRSQGYRIVVQEGNGFAEKK